MGHGAQEVGGWDAACGYTACCHRDYEASPSFRAPILQFLVPRLLGFDEHFQGEGTWLCRGEMGLAPGLFDLPAS